MGHIRLGTLPRTRKWNQVLDLIGGGAGTPEVAAATMEASQEGLDKAAKEPGLIHTVWLLTQVPLAAQGDDFVARLQRLGLKVSDSPSLLEVVGAFMGAIDAHLRRSAAARTSAKWPRWPPPRRSQLSERRKQQASSEPRPPMSSRHSRASRQA